jgi:hypothetical protein
MSEKLFSRNMKTLQLGSNKLSFGVLKTKDCPSGNFDSLHMDKFSILDAEKDYNSEDNSIDLKKRRNTMTSKSNLKTIKMNDKMRKYNKRRESKDMSSY